MESKTLNYTLVGSFVLAMLVTLIVAVAVLTGRTGITDRYDIIFQNVSGLKFGTQVLYEGFPVGQIESIKPEQDATGRMQFRVSISVTDNWQIPADSQATKAAPSLLSAFAIDIRAGGSSQFLSPGDEIQLGTSGDMFAALSEVAGEVNTLTQRGLIPLTQDLQDVVADVKVVLGDVKIAVKGVTGMLSEHGPEILENVQQVSADVAQETPVLLAQLQSFTEQLNATAARADGLLDEKIADDISVTTANARQMSEEFLTLSKDLQTMDNDVRALLSTLNETVTQNRDHVDQSIQDMQYTIATISRHVGTVARNLEGTSRHMLEFSRQIRDNPGVLIGGTTPRDAQAQ